MNNICSPSHIGKGSREVRPENSEVSLKREREVLANRPAGGPDHGVRPVG